MGKTKQEVAEVSEKMTENFKKKKILKDQVNEQDNKKDEFSINADHNWEK